MLFVSRTRATLRSAEFGFFGVVVYTRVQTPRFCGAPRSAGVFTFAFGATRPFRTSWLTVGMDLAVVYSWRGFLQTKGRRGHETTANPGRDGSKTAHAASAPGRSSPGAGMV